MQSDANPRRSGSSPEPDLDVLLDRVLDSNFLQVDRPFPEGVRGSGMALDLSFPDPGGHLVQVLQVRGWRLECRGIESPPQPMAQLAAMEVPQRRVILYIPFLRWLSEGDRWEAVSAGSTDTDGEDPVCEPFRDAMGRLSPTERFGWLCVMALSHELFHVLESEGELDAMTGTPERIESIAHRFAIQLMARSIHP